MCLVLTYIELTISPFHQRIGTHIPHGTTRPRWIRANKQMPATCAIVWNPMRPHTACTYRPISLIQNATHSWMCVNMWRLKIIRFVDNKRIASERIEWTKECSRGKSRKHTWSYRVFSHSHIWFHHWRLRIYRPNTRARLSQWCASMVAAGNFWAHSIGRRGTQYYPIG